MEQDPTLAVAWGRLARIAAQEEGRQAGRDVLDRAITSGADGPLMRHERAQLRTAEGDLAGAEGDLKAALAARPDDLMIRLDLALCLLARGMDGEAAELLSRTRLDGDSAAVIDRALNDLRAAKAGEADSTRLRLVAAVRVVRSRLRSAP